ncbi:MAG: IS110 family transposase [Thermodesulfobacteriota bacterium]|nr:IS110 family transposase [Thermodesulfobacteriota bacterium]
MKRKKKSIHTKKSSPHSLPVLNSLVAGVDLGSREHWVCGPARKDGIPNVLSFGTTTPQLEKLVAWLQEQGVVSVAMESTSIYWIPLYELLESRGFEVLLVNAQHISNVPGRKTDVLDCQWIQLLHSCGLLRGSFRPDEAICALRTLRRQWRNLIEERTKAVQWMQKALDQMNVQVHRAVSDLTGKTGMAIVRAIISGERSPLKLAEHRDRRCKKSIAEIADYLTGNWREEHLYNLESSLRFYDNLQSMIEGYEKRLLEKIKSLQAPELRELPIPAHPNPVKEKTINKKGGKEYREALWRLTGVDLSRIDGISAQTSLTVITEIGLDLSSFPNEKHFVSWLRLSPWQAYSGGKKLKKKRKPLGTNKAAEALRLAAASLHSSKTALGAYYRKIARRRGAGVAIFATARKLATLVFRMLKYGQDYTDIGEQAYEATFMKRRFAGLKSSAKSMGYELIAIKEAV